MTIATACSRRATARMFATALLLSCHCAAALEASPLLSWLKSGGGGASVRVSDGADDSVRGLVVSGRAQPGDVLLEVPLALCLSDHGAGDAAI